MAKEIFDFVIPLYRWRWSTRAVLKGLTHHYRPRIIHIIAPKTEVRSLDLDVKGWQVGTVSTHEEEDFFHKSGLTKEAICSELDLGKSLYTPGWFYQKLLKFGASEGIDDLSEWFVVWDSDLLPVDTWPLIGEHRKTIQHLFALLQHNQWGKEYIVSKWAEWIQSVLGVKPVMEREGTFIPHHMWFKREHLISFKQRVKNYFNQTKTGCC